MERFVERFRYKATKARQAQSKLKEIERLQARTRSSRTRATGARSRSRFGAAERSGRVVLELDEATIAAGDRTLIDDADLWLERGEHVCLVGANGSGKTTLVETLAGERELGGAKLRRGHNVKLGYLSQHTEASAAPRPPLLSHAQGQTGLSEAKTRALLGRFLFSGEEVEKRLTEISGGEAQRLALAMLTNSDANLLVLDEPTNHLDVESREALEDALTGVRRHRPADLPRPGAARGGRQPHARDRGPRAAQPSGRLGRVPLHGRGRGGRGRRGRASAEARAPARQPGPSKNRKAELARLEREVEEAEAAFKRLEDELADPVALVRPGALGAVDRAPRAGAGAAATS